MQNSKFETIAVVGMALRVPGARTPEQLWGNICNKQDSVTWFNSDDLEGRGVPAQLIKDPDYVPAAACIPDADVFDAELFGINRSEALMLDPQHRVFMECAWEALENCAHDPVRFDGAIGVYAGSFMNRYLLNLYTNPTFVRSPSVNYAWRYNDKDFMTGQLAYALNLRGPAITVQTACSTSLVAIHLACQGLLAGDCDLALAGGVAIRVPLRAGYLAPEGAMFSPDGRCSPFDAAASGTLPGDGCAIVALRRLSDAIADGDNVRAVILASAINNDGRNKVSFAAPSAEGQVQAIVSAQTLALADPDSIGYIEAHATGTRLGDPIEISALTEAFRLQTKREGFCALGSLKANIGHLDAAAGAAGLIRAVLALENKAIPPQTNFVELNPELRLETTPFYVPTELQHWKAGPSPRRAGVSAFAVGGTNAHAVLEEAPISERVAPSTRSHEILLVSGRDKTAAGAVAAKLGAYLADEYKGNLADVAFSLAEGRTFLRSRRFVVATDVASASRSLQEPSQIAEPDDRAPNVVFMFPGVGTQYPDMTLDIYDALPEFRRNVDLCATLAHDRLGLDIRRYLYPSRYAGPEVDRESVPNVIAAIFTVSYSLAKLWISWGVRPNAMLGHSLGEYISACVAGVIDLPDALDLSIRRGRIFDNIPAGRMMSVQLCAEEVTPLLGCKLSLGAVNAPGLSLVSGLISDLEELGDTLKRQGVESRMLPVRMASHSYLVEPYLDLLRSIVADYRLRPPSTPYLSCLSGDWIRSEEATDPDYWASQLRSPVQFEKMVNNALAQPGAVLLEVGPGNTLCTLAGAQRLPSRPNAIPTLRHPLDTRTDYESLLNAAGRLWQAGVPVDWKAALGRENIRRVALPSYPFQGKRYWIDRGVAIGPGSGDPSQADTFRSSVPQEPDTDDTAPSQAPTEMSDRQRSVLAVWQSHLGNDKIGLDDHFETVGGHSLLAAQMIPQLRKLSDAPIKVSDLFGAPTIRKLSALMESAENRASVDLASEVQLDPTVRVAGLPKGDFTSPSHILLTGGTGFLGTFLLSELLQQTTTTVHCLVRADDASDGERRLFSKLTEFGLPLPEAGRLIVVPGDLERPRLGMPAADYEALAGVIDAIIHCGARVNFARPYSVLKTANVKGTEEILRLATRRRLKAVHYVSTLFVNMGAITTGASFIGEDDPLSPPVGHANSYTESKWVAEGLCRLAADRGVPVAVYRPGNILSSRTGGVSNPEDFFTKFLQGCVDLGLVPERRAAYPVGAVDDVARMIVLFSSRNEAIGKTFHLVYPEVMSWRAMFGDLARHGYKASIVSWDQWYAAFTDKLAAGSNNALLPLADMLSTVKVDNVSWPTFGVSNASSFRSELGMPYPELNQDYFDGMFRRMAADGLLPLPTEVRDREYA